MDAEAGKTERSRLPHPHTLDYIYILLHMAQNNKCPIIETAKKRNWIHSSEGNVYQNNEVAQTTFRVEFPLRD